MGSRRVQGGDADEVLGEADEVVSAGLDLGGQAGVQGGHRGRLDQLGRVGNRVDLGCPHGDILQDFEIA